MSNEIVKHSLTEIMSVGKAFHESGLFPDIKSAAQAIVKITAGAEMGIPPFAAMSGIHIIQGKPTVGAGLMAANVKGSGKYDYRVVESTEKICSIDFYQLVGKNDPKALGAEKTTGYEKIGNSTFTIEDAKKAQTKNMDKFPKNMLFARAISNGVKWYTPDVFAGPVYVPEEMEAVVTEDVKHENVPPIHNATQAQDAETVAIGSEKYNEELQSAIAGLELCGSKKNLADLKKQLPAYIVSDASFIAAGKARYEVIMATPA